MEKLSNIDFYHTIDSFKRKEIKIKGSSFLASVYNTNSIDESMSILNKVRAEFFDATHNCWSYKIGWSGKDYRYSDDGEPSGSAGKPIYFTIGKYDLSDILVVVTRYFGGTKLGVGGLVRAYSDATEEVLKTIEIKVINLTKPVFVKCTYNDISLVKKLIDNYAISFEENYTDSVEYIIDLPLSKVDGFKSKLFNLSNGKLIGEEI